MKEFKVKIWNGEKILSVEAWSFYDNTIYVDAGDSDEYGKLLKTYRVDEVEVMQYIGLDDVNGKEIYENYIVKFGRFVGNPVTGTRWVEDIGVIRWINSRSSFRFCYNGQEQKIRDCYYYEIIGNIYENKELLMR